MPGMIMVEEAITPYTRVAARQEGAFEQHGDAAQNNANEEHGRLRRIIDQCPVHQLTKGQNADGQADGEGDQELPLFFDVVQRVGQHRQQPLIDAEYHGHGAAGYAGNDVGQAEYDARQNEIQQLHVHSPCMLLAHRRLRFIRKIMVERAG